MVLYEEHKKYGFNVATIVTTMVTALFSFGFYRQIIKGESFGNNPMPDTGLYIAITLMALLTIALYNMKLSLRITKAGVEYRLFPFHLKYKLIPVEEINSIDVVTYSPLSEFGGWGLRQSWSGKGKAYTLSGDKALRVERKSKGVILIGTEKHDELRESLMRIRQTMAIEKVT